jgi:hypothetical protein
MSGILQETQAPHMTREHTTLINTLTPSLPRPLCQAHLASDQTAQTDGTYNIFITLRDDTEFFKNNLNVLEFHIFLVKKTFNVTL